MSTRYTFRRRLTQARTALSLSKAALARKLGCDVRTIHRYEDGHTFPQPEVIDQLCRVLHVPPYRLFLECDDL